MVKRIRVDRPILFGPSHEFITLGGPGHREVTNLRRLFGTSESVFCRATHGQCVQASLGNAMDCLVGEERELEIR